MSILDQLCAWPEPEPEMTPERALSQCRQLLQGGPYYPATVREVNSCIRRFQSFLCADAVRDVAMEDPRRAARGEFTLHAHD